MVNEAVRKRLGGLHSADCLLRSVDFAAVEELQRTGRWNEAGKLLATVAVSGTVSPAAEDTQIRFMTSKVDAGHPTSHATMFLSGSPADGCQ